MMSSNHCCKQQASNSKTWGYFLCQSRSCSRVLHLDRCALEHQLKIRKILPQIMPEPGEFTPFLGSKGVGEFTG